MSTTKSYSGLPKSSPNIVQDMQKAFLCLGVTFFLLGVTFFLLGVTFFVWLSHSLCEWNIRFSAHCHTHKSDLDTVLAAFGASKVVLSLETSLKNAFSKPRVARTIPKGLLDGNYTSSDLQTAPKRGPQNDHQSVRCA